MLNKTKTVYPEKQIVEENNRYLTKVYAWMCLALIITGVIAFLTSKSPEIVKFIFDNNLVFYGLLMLEFILVLYLVAAVKKMRPDNATIVFVLYAVLNGLTLASVFLIYTAASLATTFFITSGTFGFMSAYGYFTKADLTSLGNLFFMALIGLIITSVVNSYFNNESVYWITTYIGILIFVGLTAYDTQKIKELNCIGNEGTDDDKKEAIIGALTLYLDFINLFLFFLRIFGKRK